MIQLLGSALGLGLVSGMNLYATVLTVGLGIRLGLIELRPELHQLEVLANPYVIAVAGIIFLVEFLADKVKWIDSLWDAVHTLIRPVGAAIIGATAVGEAGPEGMIIALLCGGVALSGHSTKAGLRLLVNHSPEPFSNVALSLGEDALVVFGSYLALQYPYVMLIVVIVFMIGFLWFAPKAFRLMRVEVVAIIAVFKKLLTSIKRVILRKPKPAVDGFNGGNAASLRKILNEDLPVNYLYYVKDNLKLDGNDARIRCVAGKGVRGLRHSIGYLNFTGDQLIFVSRRMLRFRNYNVARRNIDHVHFKKHLLMDRLSLRVGGKPHTFYFFKDASNRGEIISRIL